MKQIIVRICFTVYACRLIINPNGLLKGVVLDRATLKIILLVYVVYSCYPPEYSRNIFMRVLNDSYFDHIPIN